MPSEPSVEEPHASGDRPDLASTAERTIVDLRGDGPLVSLGRYRYRQARPPAPRQRHDELLVIVVPQRGTFSFDLNGTEVQVRPGQALPIAPGCDYGSPRFADGPGELVWVLAQVRGATTAGRTEANFRTVDIAVHRLASFPAAALLDAPHEARDLLSAALAEPGDRQWARRGHRRLLCSAALLQLLLRPHTTSPVPPIHPRVARVVAWLDQNVEAPVKVVELAQMAGLSLSQFHEEFGTALGTTPNDYILRLRLDGAKRLLSTTTTPITEIAAQLGFSSSQYFAQVFRRYEGLTASAYRRDVRSARDPTGQESDDAT